MGRGRPRSGQGWGSKGQDSDSEPDPDSPALPAVGGKTPYFVIFDSDGNVLVTESNNHCIRKVSPSGVVTTLAGNGKQGQVNGTGLEATFDYPRGLCFTNDGSLLVCDAGNGIIRYVSSILFGNFLSLFTFHFLLLRWLPQYLI